ncbi:MAG TPA: hypothetical protein VHW03_01985 [Chthoniobacterales bacterium]|jgi:hypothetical protein|nr:hypothetical protein [Chthoniobacterales bacterium]
MNDSYEEIIGRENISRDARGEPVISDAGFDRLIKAMEEGTIAVPTEVLRSALAVREEAKKIRNAMKRGLN